MGKAPKELGAMGANLAVCVAFHPQEEVVAIGYQDGMILAVRVDDGKEAMMRQPGGGAIASMNWHESGKQIAFGTDQGKAGVIDLAV